MGHCTYNYKQNILDYIICPCCNKKIKCKFFLSPFKKYHIVHKDCCLIIFTAKSKKGIISYEKITKEELDKFILDKLENNNELKFTGWNDILNREIFVLDNYFKINYIKKIKKIIK